MKPSFLVLLVVARDDAGQVLAFVDVAEVAAGVLRVLALGPHAAAMGEAHLRILLGHLQHVRVEVAERRRRRSASALSWLIMASIVFCDGDGLGHVLFLDDLDAGHLLDRRGRLRPAPGCSRSRRAGRRRSRRRRAVSAPARGAARRAASREAPASAPPASRRRRGRIRWSLMVDGSFRWPWFILRSWGAILSARAQGRKGHHADVRGDDQPAAVEAAPGLALPADLSAGRRLRGGIRSWRCAKSSPKVVSTVRCKVRARPLRRPRRAKGADRVDADEVLRRCRSARSMRECSRTARRARRCRCSTSASS